MYSAIDFLRSCLSLDVLMNLYRGMENVNPTLVLGRKNPEGIFPSQHCFGKTMLEEASEFIQQYGGKENLYYSPFLQDGNKVIPGKRGTGETSMCAPIIGFDIDIQSDEGAHKATELPSSIKEALDVLRGEGLPDFTPYWVVDSGNGLHLYYKPLAPVIFSEGEDSRRKWLLVAHGMFESVRIAWERHGWHLDNCTTNLAQMFRIPGTFNHKTDPPKEVRILETNENAVYPFEDLHAWALSLPKEVLKVLGPDGDGRKAPQPKMPSDASSGRIQEEDRLKAEEILSVLLKLRPCIRHALENSKSLTYQEWFALAGALKDYPHGRILFHLLSEPYAGYTFEEAEAKFDEVEKFEGAPRTCGTMYFPCCEGCVYLERIRTPLEKTQQYWEVPEIFRPLLERGFLVPDGFAITKDGIFSPGEEENTWDEIAGTPMVLLAYKKKSNGTEDAIIFCRAKTGKLKTCFMDVGTFMDPRLISRLSSYAISINRKKKDELVNFFEKWMDCNKSVMSTTTVLDRQGWHKENFILGHTVQQQDQAIPMICEDLPEAAQCTLEYVWPENQRNHIAGYFEKGTREGWWEGAFPILKDFSIPLFCFYASLAAPLLTVLGVDSFIIELGCPSSKGKTTVLMLVDSVWGNVKDDDIPSILASFDITHTGVEGFARINSDLPICLDDTKGKREDLKTAKLLYDLCCSGNTIKGREDSSCNILHRRKKIVFISGETSLLKKHLDEGLRGRVVSSRKSPLGENDVAKAVCVRRFYNLIAENYGIIGREYLAHLVPFVATRKEEILRIFGECLQAYMKAAGDNNFFLRQASYFAAVETAGLLAMRFDLIPEGLTSPCEVVWKMWKDVCRNILFEDEGCLLLVQLHEKGILEERFTDLEHYRPDDHYGFWDKGRNLWIDPGVFSKILRYTKSSSEEDIVQKWIDKSWLYTKTDGRGNLKKKFRKLISGKQPLFYVLHRRAFEELEIIDDSGNIVPVETNAMAETVVMEDDFLEYWEDETKGEVETVEEPTATEESDSGLMDDGELIDITEPSSTPSDKDSDEYVLPNLPALPDTSNEEERNNCPAIVMEPAETEELDVESMF